MNDWVYFLLQTLLVVIGALFIKFAIDNYKEKRYYLFGLDVFLTVDYMITMAGLSLVKWEVITL